MGHRFRVVRTAAAAIAVTSLFAASACGGDGDSDGASSTGSPTTVPDTTVPDPTVPDPTVPDTTESTATSTTSTTSPSPTTEPAYPTTTMHQVPAVCDDELDEMLAVVDRSIVDAQLDGGGAWIDATDGIAFDGRTQTAEEFRYRMGLDCTARLAQTTAAGDERIVLAAWTGDRRAWVVQATDGPAVPYRADQRVQLFIEQPLGEWLFDQFVWAGSLETGETVIVGTVDTAFGVAAKSWLSEVSRFEDLEVTNDAERYAIDALLQAGNRNVSVAEPAAFQSEIAAIQFITPLGLHLIATIAPPDWFDPAAAIVEGEMVVESIGGVDVYVTTAVPESYAVGSVGWMCAGEGVDDGSVEGYVWFVDSAFGTMEELIAWTADLIESAGC